MISADRIAAGVERELRGLGDPERAERERAYLKSELRFFGATVPAVRRVVRSAWREHGGLDHDTMIDAAGLLWATGVFECRMAAEDLIEMGSAMLTVSDVPFLERLLREARTWALVDGLAAGPVGELDRRPPGIGSTIERWAVDEDFWIRRSALLTHLGPARRGDGDLERFFRLADGMLEETEFFIRKAIGWVLREAAKQRPDAVASWLEPRIGRASGVTVREAVKYLSPADRERLISGYRGR